MRSLVIATDFIRKTDGTLTPLEINTNAGYEIRVNFPQDGSTPDFIENFSQFFNHVEFNNFLSGNGINKIVAIDKPGGVSKILESFSAHYNYQYELVSVPEGSLTIPEVEDGPDKLIVRVSYDAYALVDDLYARDMFEFHSLIKDEPFSPKVTFNTGTQDNIDLISIFEPSVNGIAPNYLIKPRVPGYQRGIYPKIYRIDTQEELDNLKSSLTENEFLEKFEFHPELSLIDNRVHFIRSIDLIYGSNLDVINLLKYKSIHNFSTQNTLLRYNSELIEGKKLDVLFSAKWHPKFHDALTIIYDFDQTDYVLMPNGTDKIAGELVVGDSVKGIRFTDPIKDFQPAPISDLENFTTGETPVVAINENPGQGVFINITASTPDGEIYQWYDGIINKYLVKKEGSDQVQYVSQTSGEIETGDTIFSFNISNQSLVPLVISDIFYDFKNLSTYQMSLGQDFKEFLVKIDENMYLLQHNNDCSPGCGAWYGCGSQTLWGAQTCNLCGKGSVNCPICTSFGGAYVCNSDLNLKENLVNKGKSAKGINIYWFNYKGDDKIYQGVIAQELLSTRFSDAVILDGSGTYKVDYSKIDVEFKKIN